MTAQYEWSEALVVLYTPVSIQETVLRWRLTLKDKADDAALPAAPTAIADR